MRQIGVAVALVAVTVLLPLAAVSCAPRHVSPAGTARFDDATISTRVKTALLNDPEIGALKIDVNTTQGVVTLSGVARSRAEEQKAVAVAKGIAGVKDVKSNLQIQGSD